MRRFFRFLRALWRYILYGHRVDFDTYCNRLENCRMCEHFKESNWTCGICGCFLTKKAPMNTEHCPDGKW